MFSRLRCHFCGKRSQFSKGTTEFQCTNCEALNFYDKRGQVVEPPAIIVDPPSQQKLPQSKPFASFTRPTSSGSSGQDDDIFCKTCRKNQQTYMEVMSAYYPEDEGDDEKFEAGFNKFKANLERKYPQVCKKCAKRAQQKLYEADYMAKTKQAGAMMRATRERRGQSPIGQRDDWAKWTMRRLLGLIGMVVYASLLIQMAWHAYGILAVTFAPPFLENLDTTGFALDATFLECAQQSKLLRFDDACYRLFSTIIPKALIGSLVLLWYNNGLKDWYHHTHRMEAVSGQTEHFRTQVFLLIVRTVAYFQLSNPSVTTHFSKQQKLAAHGFMIVFMSLSQWVSEKCLKSERWKLRGKIMPKPDEVDIFSETAGPAEEQYNRQASSVPPTLRLFARDERPFPIANLAPKPVRGYSKLEIPTMPPPSPPDSHSASDDDMDIDWRQPKQSQTRSTYNYGSTQPLGWSSMRNEIFGIEDKTRAEDERKRKEEEERAKLRYQPPVEQSPFRGRLPPAPMSMERKLRNPPRQFNFKAAPLSKQQDFMQQMRQGIENGKSFGQPKAEAKQVNANVRQAYDEDDEFSPIKSRTRSGMENEDFTPAKSRTRGNLDLHDSGWKLKSDFSSPTGLEEFFTSSFNIEDRPKIVNSLGSDATPAPRRSKSALAPWTYAVGVPVALIAIGWNVQPVRRAVCLWLVQQIEQLGY